MHWPTEAPWDRAERARLAAEVDALANRLARTRPEAMSLIGRMLNRSMALARFRQAVEAGLDLGAIISAVDTSERSEWDAIARREGFGAVLARRDRRRRPTGRPRHLTKTVSKSGLPPHQAAEDRGTGGTESCGTGATPDTRGDA